jgi:hypothetical protein
MTHSHYHFYASLRTGLATTLTQPATGARAESLVELVLEANVIGSSTVNTARVEKLIQLWGPGDIVGFDDRIITRTDPKPNVGDFEPNYFPFVEFSDPAFVWRFTADAASEDSGNLIPWITLIVLRAESTDTAEAEFELKRDSLSQRPYLEITSSKCLPNLTFADRWAHVQVTGPSTLGNVNSIIRNQPHRAVCRLLCPRRLQPRTKYQAFVVPTFRLGRQAGLGEPLEETSARALAWDDAIEHKGMKLPYYYTWEFRTGWRGDFEHLVRLLEKRDLNNLGLRDMHCDQPGFGLPGVNHDIGNPAEGHILEVEGALQPEHPGFRYTPWGEDAEDNALPPFQEELAELLNSSETDLNQQQFRFKVVAVAPMQEIMAELAPNGYEVTLTWKTQRWAICQLQYERYAIFQQNQTYGVTTPVTNTNAEQTRHQVTFKSLVPGEIYALRIVCTDRARTVTFTPDGILQLPTLPAVIPPLYGCWYAAKRIAETNQKNWFHRLNLDPRHRVAAGLGAEVVRKQQEPLMASAWEQLGEIEKANDLLRRAQMGRAASSCLHDRLRSLLQPKSSSTDGNLGLDTFLSVTRPVQNRLGTTKTDANGDPANDNDGNPVKTTIAQKLTQQSQLPAAALDPAFRRIAKSRGPLRKRQSKPKTGLLRRLADGTLQPAGTHPRPDGMLGVCDITKVFWQVVQNENEATQPTPVTAWENRFCEENISCGRLNIGAFQTDNPEVPDQTDSKALVCNVLDYWLNNQPDPESPPQPTENFLDEVAQEVLDALDPARTILERTHQRLYLDDVRQLGDPLGLIMAAPEFPQPTCEYIAQDWILPGIEKVPQNTIGLLKSNRRFIEAYMVGLNHEFGKELLWRGYPTDQRGTYFRQFWDVRESIPTSGHEDGNGLNSDTLEALKENLKDIRPIHTWRDSDLGRNDNRAASGQGENLILIIRGDLLKKYPNTLIYAIEGSSNPSEATHHYAIFSGTLPPDITFLGFSFDTEQARGNANIPNSGIYFVIEERISEARFGMDEPLDKDILDNSEYTHWKDLSWARVYDPEHVEKPIQYGQYLNDLEPIQPAEETLDWGKSSAAIAHITCQDPVRMIIHARDMLPSDI